MREGESESAHVITGKSPIGIVCSLFRPVFRSNKQIFPTTWLWPKIRNREAERARWSESGFLMNEKREVWSYVCVGK